MAARLLSCFFAVLLCAGESHRTVPVSSAEDDEVLCNEAFRCVPVSKCHLGPDSFLYPCHFGLNLVCCPYGAYNTSALLENRKTSLFPVNCGLVYVEDKIISGEVANLGQFPWMALLGYKQKGVDFIQFLCGGSIISERYVLTAAHCINLDDRLKLSVARLGENDILTETDCVHTRNGRDCSSPHVDAPVEKVIPHKAFSNTKLIHDIALIKLAIRITFSDYIQPVCLPFERNLEKRNLKGQKFKISGWGKTKSANLGGSTVLMFAEIKVWDQGECDKAVPPEVKPLQDSQLCANGEKREDACKGDSGGPLVNQTVGLDGEFRFYQVGIASFASTMICGNPKLPTVYTRIDKYLQWIIENVA